MRGQLHKKKWQGLTPNTPPVCNERREQFFVCGGISRIGFALIPNRAADRERLQGSDHSIVQRAGAIMATPSGHLGSGRQRLAFGTGITDLLRVNAIPLMLIVPVNGGDVFKLTGRHALPLLHQCLAFTGGCKRLGAHP